MIAFVMAMSASRSGRQDDVLDSCITRMAAGDLEALGLLYEQTHAAVYGFALSILKNRQDAEDVLQDVYLQIWKGCGGYASAGKPMAWIFTITRNLALMRLREQERTVAMTPEDWHGMFADLPAVSQEDQMTLEAVLGVLSDEERQIVLLHVMTGLKHREIAGLLQMKLSTVLSKYNRALNKLRLALKEAD